MLDAKEAAKIFSSKEINAVVRGEFDFLLRVAARYEEQLGDNFVVEDVFDYCFKDISKNYKCEYYLKSLIARKILFGRHSINTATLFNEFRVGDSRADCVILNGISTCYEIKSEYDNVSRLVDQLCSYLKIFDKVNVVATESHVEKILKIAPESVGVIKLGKRDVFTQIRPALLSEDDVDVGVMMASLRRGEYVAMVKELCGFVPAATNVDIYQKCLDMLRGVESSALRKSFCRILKTSRKADVEYLSGVPKSLQIAAIEYPMSTAGRADFLQSMSVHFSKEALCITQSSKQNDMSLMQ
ncbi:sce7726 family protein [Pseudomonas alkylphenolica]|uniref:sce7726 family protein n=1 Tax=Pseudomonas alkylphenolica TaxID=237609 RepID=UPI00339A9EEB